MQVGRLIVVAQLQGNLGPGFALQLQVHFQLGAGLVEQFAKAQPLFVQASPQRSRGLMQLRAKAFQGW